MNLLKLVTPPSGNVVSLQDVKAQARIDGNEEDVLLNAYIATATAQAEAITQSRLLTQTWDWFMDTFPCEDLRVPLYPLVSVDSVKYYDKDNVQQTWSSANYQVDMAGLMPRLVPVSGVDWPETYDRINAVEIRLTVGYGAAAAVPQAIKHWITAAVAEACKTRELTADRSNVGESLSSFMNGLLDPYTVPTIQ